MKTARSPLIGILVIALLTAAVWYVGYRPANAEQASLAEETQSLEDKEQQLQARIAQLESIKEKAPEHQAELAKLQQFLPDGTAQPAALSQIQDAGDAAGVDIASISFGEPTIIEDAPTPALSGRRLAEVTLTTNVSGGYFKIVDLLRRFEVDMDRAIMIDGIDLAEGEDGFPQLQVTLNGRVFGTVPAEDDASSESGGSSGSAGSGAPGGPSASPSPSAAPEGGGDDSAPAL